jgi:hypothetical protein
VHELSVCVLSATLSSQGSVVPVCVGVFEYVFSLSCDSSERNMYPE